MTVALGLTVAGAPSAVVVQQPLQSSGVFPEIDDPGDVNVPWLNTPPPVPAALCDTEELRREKTPPASLKIAPPETAAVLPDIESLTKSAWLWLSITPPPPVE
jgi:hypothetical protein